MLYNRNKRVLTQSSSMLTWPSRYVPSLVSSSLESVRARFGCAANSMDVLGPESLTAWNLDEVWEGMSKRYRAPLRSATSTVLSFVFVKQSELTWRATWL